MQNPLLSIGIIFRDDIRSIERCLKALEPLRDAVPCEVVMADTGSADGSRAVAERYADILFDFPWIDDFSAARNAVIDRCTGEWYITVDTDEYLDEDISELESFLKSKPSLNLCRVVIRNYDRYEMDGAWSDFFNMRMIRLSTGGRYQGLVHESWVGLEHAGKVQLLSKTVFHHDGYVGMKNNKKKLERNMSLLRKRLKEAPKDLLVRLQVIESGGQEPDFLEQVRRAVSMVKRKGEGWQTFGPSILRHAVAAAQKHELPELSKWAQMAEEWFPESYCTRIDVACMMLADEYTGKKYDDCIRRGEALLASYRDYFAGKGDMTCQIVSTLLMASPYYERNVQMLMANAYLEKEQPEKSLALLEEIDYSALDLPQIENLAKTVCFLHSQSGLDTTALVRTVWDSVSACASGQKQAKIRKNKFLLTASAMFSAGYQENEKTRTGYCRPAYTVFLPLAGKCPLGTAAAMLETDDPAELARLLGTVEEWGELSTPALAHALECGVIFPLPDKPMGMEELDRLAERLAQDKQSLFRIAEGSAQDMQSANWQRLDWVRALSLAAVRAFGWNAKQPDREQGWSIARNFARVEAVFLPRYYASAVLCAENIFALPPMHRFGWYCIQAFDALKTGKPAGYARFLREGLSMCEEMKPMVQFLLEYTPELQAVKPAGELLALAEKVRAMLSAYAPDDPAVVMIKQSAAYQKVANLIEGPEAGVFGGLAQ